MLTWDDMVGWRIKTLRREQGMSQIVTAEKSRVTLAKLIQCESGTCCLSSRDFYALADLFGVSIEQIMN